MSTAANHQFMTREEYLAFERTSEIKHDPTGLYTYPDVVVACDDPQFEDAEVDTLLTPTVIIEVLSESTKDYDRVTLEDPKTSKTNVEKNA